MPAEYHTTSYGLNMPTTLSGESLLPLKTYLALIRFAQKYDGDWFKGLLQGKEWFESEAQGDPVSWLLLLILQLGQQGASPQPYFPGPPPELTDFKKTQASLQLLLTCNVTGLSLVTAVWSQHQTPYQMIGGRCEEAKKVMRLLEASVLLCDRLRDMAMATEPDEHFNSSDAARWWLERVPPEKQWLRFCALVEYRSPSTECHSEQQPPDTSVFSLAPGPLARSSRICAKAPSSMHWHMGYVDHSVVRTTAGQKATWIICTMDDSVGQECFFYRPDEVKHLGSEEDFNKLKGSVGYILADNAEYKGCQPPFAALPEALSWTYYRKAEPPSPQDRVMVLHNQEWTLGYAVEILRKYTPTHEEYLECSVKVPYFDEPIDFALAEVYHPIQSDADINAVRHIIGKDMAGWQSSMYPFHSYYKTNRTCLPVNAAPHIIKGGGVSGGGDGGGGAGLSGLLHLFH